MELGDGAGRDRGPAVDAPLSISRDDLATGPLDDNAPLLDRRDGVRADPGLQQQLLGQVEPAAPADDDRGAVPRGAALGG